MEPVQKKVLMLEYEPEAAEMFAETRRVKGYCGLKMHHGKPAGSMQLIEAAYQGIHKPGTRQA
jgi:hypothetical protein